MDTIRQWPLICLIFSILFVGGIFAKKSMEQMLLELQEDERKDPESVCRGLYENECKEDIDCYLNFMNEESVDRRFFCICGDCVALPVILSDSNLQRVQDIKEMKEKKKRGEL